MKVTSHSGTKIGQVCVAPHPLNEIEGFLRFGLLSSITNTLCWLHRSWHISALPHKTQRTREMETSMELMPPAVLWVINSIVSDPGVSRLLSASWNCGRLNYHLMGPHTLPIPWWPSSSKSQEFKMLSYLPSFFPFLLTTVGAKHSALNQCLVMAPWER